MASEQPRTIRRGLPRVRGGEPWPIVTDVVGASAHGAATADVEAQTPPVAAIVSGDPAAVAVAVDAATVRAPEVAVERSTEATVPLRRGLPRVRGGEPWPPAGVAVRASESLAPSVVLSDSAAARTGPQPPLTFTPTVWPGRYAFIHPAPPPEPKRIGPLTRAQWAGALIVGGLALIAAAGLVVFAVRWLVSFGPLADFIVTFPGETPLPEGAPIGFPAWLGWQHFFNLFLIVLIIRSGLQVRTEKRPSTFWSPRRDPKRRISLSLWFHQALDVLWVANGVIFVVLLFVTGQWMRVVPTMWEVVPNALSALLQYVSLEWPTDNGWVNYNSLQVLAYFVTIFIAAPLAIVTGVRMSGFWPQRQTALNRILPIEVARAVHFPVMLYFAAFIVVHVALVFATGALRNLNHMFAAQGSPDPAVFAANWTGFWIFVAAMAVLAIGWIAARPIVLAGIARAFGTVSSR